MLIDIDKIKIQNRIRKDFGDIQELADDIKENGLINPPVVIPEEDGTFTLLAGERRLRAMKSLGYQQVEVRTWKNLSDEEKLNVEISENEVRKDFSKAERIDYARRLERIEAAKAKERMVEGRNQYSSPRPNLDEPGRTDEVVAAKLGIGGRSTYRKEKFIVDNQSSLTPEDFADWDEGKLSTNKAFNRIKEMLKAAEEKNQEQERKLSSAQNLVADYKKDNSQLQQRLDQVNVDNRKLRSENETLKQQRTETVIKEVQVENPETLQELQSYKKENKILEDKINALVRQMELNKEDAEKYQKLQEEIEFLSKRRSDLVRKVDSATELSGLTVRLQQILETDLAPIKFKRCMDELQNPVAIENLSEIVYKVQSWVDEMSKYLNEEYIDVNDVNIENN